MSRIRLNAPFVLPSAGLTPIIIIALAFALAGCPVRPTIHGPDDAYRAVMSSASEDELAAARALLERQTSGPDAERATWVLIRDAYDHKRYGEIDERLGELERTAPASAWIPPAVYIRLLAARDTEGSLRLVQRLDEALTRFAGATAFQAGARSLAPDALTACSQSDLETYLAAPTRGPLEADVELALGRLHLKRGADDDAVRILRRLVSDHPDAAAAPDAFALLRELSRKVPVNARVIGALFPSTGDSARHGQSVLQGVKLAQEEIHVSGTPFEFVFVDTAEDPATALGAMDTLVRDRQVVALFGPLFSATALACAVEANALGVVMLTPSALAPRLPQTGPYVFRGALTPESEARTMATFAVQTKGFHRLGVVAPDNAYGRRLAGAFAAEVLAAGGTVVVESRYPPQINDFGDAIVAAGGADIAGYKEMDEEFRRVAQGELEQFLQKFFAAAAIRPAPDAASTVADGGAAPADDAAPSRVACLGLTADPYTNELAQRLRAAAPPHKTITVLNPESATGYSIRLNHADVSDAGQLAGPEELALGDLVSSAGGAGGSSYAVLISVAAEPVSPAATFQPLECTLAMYDSHNSRQVALHAFKARRPLPPRGNRFALDALYIPAPGGQLLHLVPQLVYHSLALPILGSDTWADEALRRKPEDVTLEAYFTTAFWPDLPRLQTKSFTQRYQTAYAAAPDPIAAAAYDAAKVLMTAILKSDGTREGVRQALADSGGFEGVSGPGRMTPQRELEQDAVIMKVDHGNILPAR